MTTGPTIDDIHFEEAPRVETEIPGPRSKAMLDRQREIDTNAVAYPRDVPIAIDSARGATVKDVDGNVFLDFFAGIGVLNVGHANPYVLEGAQEQLATLVHTIDFPTEARLALIEKLDEIAPNGLKGQMRVVFGGPTGSDAIEGSIKLAKANTGGRGLVAFRGGYHGSTAGALSLTAGKKYKADYSPLLPDVVHAPYPYPFREGRTPEESVENALSNLREIFEDSYGGIANPAGIWIEPIQGEGGIVVPPDGFLTGVKEIAEENGVPLIMDEIQTGFGRTGEWFASDHWGVTPDAMPMAKGIGGIGLPLSGTMYHEDLDTWGPGGHIGTFRGHLPAMVAGTRAIEYIQTHDLLAHTRTVGQQIRSRLGDALEDCPLDGEVRGKGLFIGVEFRHPAGLEATEETVNSIQQYCYEHGVLVWTAGRHGSVLRLIPPLVVTAEQADVGAEIIAEGIAHATEQAVESSA